MAATTQLTHCTRSGSAYPQESDCWYEFDDDTVSKVKKEEIVSSQGLLPLNPAYMLFYHRRPSPPSPAKEKTSKKAKASNDSDMLRSGSPSSSRKEKSEKSKKKKKKSSKK